jgi:dihydropteroate synthase
VSVEEELARVLPVVERLASELPVPVSIDTSKPEVMRRAIEAGAGMVNDVRALREAGAIDAIADSAAAACLMHMQGEPRTMQQAPAYGDVVSDVRGFLGSRVEACREAGIGEGRLAIDPGFGFGKTLEHNLELLGSLDRLVAEGLPVLVGLSRKSLVGQITGRGSGERLPGSLALAAIAVLNGASIVRAHDVAATVDAVRIAAAVRARQGEPQA